MLDLFVVSVAEGVAFGRLLGSVDVERGFDGEEVQQDCGYELWAT